MCKMISTCDFDRIHWLPLTPANRAKLNLCPEHTDVVNAAEPCLDVAVVDVAIGNTGQRREERMACERPKAKCDGQHFHSLPPHGYGV